MAFTSLLTPPSPPIGDGNSHELAHTTTTPIVRQFPLRKSVDHSQHCGITSSWTDQKLTTPLSFGSQVPPDSKVETRSPSAPLPPLRRRPRHIYKQCFAQSIPLVCYERHLLYDRSDQMGLSRDSSGRDRGGGLWIALRVKLR